MTLTVVTLTIALALAGGPARATAVAATPSPSPGADTITIGTPVTVIPLGGAGGGVQLAVTADSTTPLLSMTVHLLDSVAGTDSLDVAMTGPVGIPQAGMSTWTSQGIMPGTLPETLPLGRYSITVDATDQGGAAVASVPAGTLPFQATPRIAQATGNYVISGANKHPLIGGTITELAPGATTPVPYAGQPIVLHDPVEGDIPLSTDSAGAYREALPRPAAGETITAEIPPTTTTVAAAAKPVTLTVRTAITGFRATLSPYWQVSFGGCLGLAAGTPGSAPSLAGLTIQYSAGPHGPWHTLGAVASQRGLACGDAGRTFTGVLIAKLSGAYYRASYQATGKAAAGYLPSVSASVHAWKYVTAITHLKVSKRTVAPGGKLTVSGQLAYGSGSKWHVLAHQAVLIILLPRHSSTWYWIARVTTNAKGNFSSTFTDPVTAVWSAEYLGDKTHLASVGAMIPVTVS